jgi:ribonuclease P protein component
MPGPGARPQEKPRGKPRGAVGRLIKRRDFLAAASGRRFHTERMTVQGLVREDADGLRFGITVTKKVGHATERNRIRRRLRTAIGRAAVDHPGRNADVVVIGRRPALGAPHDLLVEDLRRALSAVTKPRSAREPAPRPRAETLSTDGERRGSPHA